MEKPTIELTYHTDGPFAATFTDDRQWATIDWVNGLDRSKALRLKIPAAALQNCIAALTHLQEHLEDPTKGFPKPAKH